MPIRTVQDLIDAHFGVASEEEDTSAFVQSTNVSTVMLPQQPRRTSFAYVNLGANPAFINPFGVASAARGILCPANSLTSIGFPDDLGLAAREWQVVSPAGNTAGFIVSELIA